MVDDLRNAKNELQDDVKRYVALENEIDVLFGKVKETFRDAEEEVISKVFTKKMLDVWNEQLYIVVDCFHEYTYNERLDALEQCIKMIEFAEFSLKE